MRKYAGIDVSLEVSSICIVDEAGQVIWEGRASSDPDGLRHALRRHEGLERVGLEAGPLSEWLFDGLTAAGFDVVLMETRHLQASLSAMPTKSDRSDARGIAQALRAGWFRPVHVKSAPARQIRALLAARRLIVSKRADVEAGIRGLLRGFGLKVGKTTPARFGARALALASGTSVEAIVRPLVEVHAALRMQELAFDRQVYALAKADPVSRLLASAPGVGAIVALTFRAAVDDPHRFRRARQAGAQFGLIPRRYQSGALDRMGGISRAGDASVRAALYEAATAILGRLQRPDPLALWAHRIAARRGLKRARVALARKLAVVLLAMWKTQTAYRTTAA